MGYLSTDKKKITATTLRDMKAAGEKIAQITAYDFTTAKIFDEAGIDSILIGDLASNVMCGNNDTLPITVDEMIYHASRWQKPATMLLLFATCRSAVTK